MSSTQLNKAKDKMIGTSNPRQNPPPSTDIPMADPAIPVVRAGSAMGNTDAPPHNIHHSTEDSTGPGSRPSGPQHPLPPLSRRGAYRVYPNRAGDSSLGQATPPLGAHAASGVLSSSSPGPKEAGKAFKPGVQKTYKPDEEVVRKGVFGSSGDTGGLRGTESLGGTSKDTRVNRSEREGAVRSRTVLETDLRKVKSGLHNRTSEKDLHMRHDAPTSETQDLQKQVEKLKLAVQKANVALQTERQLAASNEQALRGEWEDDRNALNDELGQLKREVQGKESRAVSDRNTEKQVSSLLTQQTNLDARLIDYEKICHERDKYWGERNDQLHEKNVRQSVKIALLEERLKMETLAKLRLQENFNIRGGLERIVYEGRLEGMIGVGCPRGAKAGLEAITKLPSFQDALDREVSERALVKTDVLYCISGAYQKYSEAAHGNNGHLIIRHEDHSDNQVAALVVLLKVQEAWKNPLRWTEVPLPGPMAQ
ncbi:hypothetical protein B9Z19DRAFT_1120492 [Tuber borchii]|uniref:Uncharacterized protein n=1 Tax=Tuber borchii TaxID=42251 RepID=A0A2T7A4C3_TUBBO|nr:hypothetical protein B9Z19DRAFT_1120492 [Tuber borchii]